MAQTLASPAPGDARRPLPWPFTGLTRPQALERRNRLITRVFIVAGVLGVAWLLVIGWLFTRPTDTIEQLLAAARLQYRVMFYGLLIMGLWALPIVIVRYSRPYMPQAD